MACGFLTRALVVREKATIAASFQQPGTHEPAYKIVPSPSLLQLLVVSALPLLAADSAAAGTCSGCISHQPTIFVGIASYRDLQCKDTLADMFAKADRPEHIFVGLCEQNAEPEEACVTEALGPHAARVRRVVLDAKQAAGPTYARYLASTLYRGEAFYLQLDSHTAFTRGWDTRLLAMHAALPDPPHAIVSGQPAPSTNTEETTVPVLCATTLDGDGMMAVHGMLSPPTVEPLHVPFVSGGFLLAPGSVLAVCPLDPNLPGLFWGDDLLYSARLWTHGYRFYAPSTNVVFHYYQPERPAAPQFWDGRDAIWRAQRHITQAKVRLLLAGGLRGYPHGLGHNSTLQQYWRFAGTDPARRIVTKCTSPPRYWEPAPTASLEVGAVSAGAM